MTPSTKQKGSNASRIAGMALKFALPAIISIGLCLALFYDIDFSEMMAIIRNDCDFRWIGLMLAMSIIPMILRAMRWGIQLRAIGVVPPFHILLYSIFGTYAVNLVFPRLGEVWRTGYIAYRQDSPFPEIFGSMIADRAADTITVLLILLATLVIASGPIIGFVQTYPEAYTAMLALATSPWTWGIALLSAGAIWALLHFCHIPLIAKTKSFLRGLWDGFAAIARMKGKGKWLLLTVGIWGCYFMQLYVTFFAFPMTRELLADHGMTVVLVCFILTSISMGIPSNGGIGPYQTTMLFGLGVFMPHAAKLTATNAAAHSAFMTTGAAFGNVIIASQTLMLIALGLVTFTLIAIDKRHNRITS